MTPRIDAIAGAAADGALGASAGRQATPAALDAQSFSDLLAAHHVRLEGSGASAASVAPARAGQAHAPGASTPGDAILRGITRMGGDLRASWHHLHVQAGDLDGSLSAREMFALQWHMVSMSVQFEAIGKGVSKATQNVDQLVRMQ